MGQVSSGSPTRIRRDSMLLVPRRRSIGSSVMSADRGATTEASGHGFVEMAPLLNEIESEALDSWDVLIWVDCANDDWRAQFGARDSTRRRDHGQWTWQLT